MKLFYDCETTGFIDQRLPVEHHLQPHLVQLGLILTTDSEMEVASADLTVRPEGYQIPEQASKVHGITTEIAREIGVPFATVMSVFLQLRANASEVVTFNRSYDDFIIRASIHRTGRVPSHPGPTKNTCCMALVTPIMKMAQTEKMKGTPWAHKNPKLEEAYSFFMKRPMVNAHNAIWDARATKEIYFAATGNAA